MKKLNEMSLSELKQELIKHYDGNAGEMFYGLIEMGISKSMMKKALVKMIERKQNEQINI